MRKLAPDEAALWKRVIATVKPIHAAKPLPFRGGVGGGAVEQATKPDLIPARPASLPHPNPASGRPCPRQGLNSAGRCSPDAPKGEGLKKVHTLDASWDRRLSRGLVAPESSVDLHGHSLSAAYDRLDRGLEAALAREDRVLLLITGKPPAPESERPHSRGAIRAAVSDWLAASRFADRIAAVRGAHPRHGGSGALYIVLRRKRPAAPSRKS